MKFTYYMAKRIQDGRCNLKVVTENGLIEFNVMTSSEAHKMGTQALYDDGIKIVYESETECEIIQPELCGDYTCAQCYPFSYSYIAEDEDIVTLDDILGEVSYLDEPDYWTINEEDIIEVNPCQDCKHFDPEIARINGKVRYGCTNLKAIKEYRRMNFKNCKYKGELGYRQLNGLILKDFKDQGLLEV